jgi:hypothetical protein
VEQSGAQHQALGIVEQRASPPADRNSNGHRHARLAELLERHECAALGGLIQADVALAGLFLEAWMETATARCPPQISARDRSSTTSAASMSYPVPRSAIGSTGAGDLILANDKSLGASALHVAAARGTRRIAMARVPRRIAVTFFLLQLRVERVRVDAAPRAARDVLTGGTETDASPMSARGDGSPRPQSLATRS